MNAFQGLLIVLGIFLLCTIGYLWFKVGCSEWRMNVLILFIIYFVVAAAIWLKAEGVENATASLKNVVPGIVETTGKVNVSAGVSVDSFIGNKVVEGLENRIDYRYLPINNHIAGSYNSCFGSDLVVAHIDNLKWVLKAGYRVVDFEVYMEDSKATTNVPGKIAVVGSGVSSKKNCLKEQPKMITEYPKATIDMKTIFKNIMIYGFKGHQYANIPLFINLRIKSPDTRIYTLLSDDIKVLKDYLPDSDQFGKYGSNRTSDLDKIKYTPLNSPSLTRKVIIMVEDYCNGYENTPFAPFVHLAVGKNLRVYNSSELSTKEISPQEQMSTLTLIKPDNQDALIGKQSQPHLANSKFNGINFMLWNIRCPDCIEPNSKTKNLGSVTINKEKAEENGIPETKSNGFFGFFEAFNFVRRSKNLWKYEEKVSPVINTQVNQCDATNKCVRQAWDRTKNKWIFTEDADTRQPCDTLHDKYPTVVELPSKKNNNECVILDRNDPSFYADPNK